MTRLARRRLLLAGSLLGLSRLADVAAQAPRRYRVGAMMATAAGSAPLEARAEWATFAAEMRDYGYATARNVEYLWYPTRPRRETMDEVAAKLVAATPDVILVSGTTATLAVKRATRTIPVVSLNVGDPVGAGIAASLQRPGGNVTGIANLSTEINAKRLELLASAVPGLRAVGVLLNPENRNHAAHVRSLQASAATLRLELSIRDARTAEELGAAFEGFGAAKVQAVYVQHDTVFFNRRRQIGELALLRRLPIISGTAEFAEAGALLSYGANRLAVFREAARLVDKILKGADVREIPFERVTTLELVVNRKTEKALGAAIPTAVLLRADQVIE